MRMGYILLLIFLVPAAAYAGPCISFEEEKYYFGKVYKNELREHLFEFENTGDEDLLIKELASP